MSYDKNSFYIILYYIILYYIILYYYYIIKCIYFNHASIDVENSYFIAPESF